jgi:hypothetical protein
MDPERFEQLGLAAVRWAYQTHRLYIGAQALAEPEGEATRVVLSLWGTRSNEQLEAIQQLKAYTNASNLLYGLAIENAYKTRQILDGKVQVEGGAFKGMRTGHNILEMVRSYKIRLNEKEVDVLKFVTFATVSMGKYPIALSAEKQRAFTGRMYRSDAVAPLTHRVILELLRESPYTDIFLKGRHSGVEDTRD